MRRAEVMATALELRQWAETTGVFSQGRSTGLVTDRDLLSAAGMFGAGAEVFAAKPITAVGFAMSRQKQARLFIYTRRQLTQAEQAGLAKPNRLGLPVEFRVARPFVVSAPTTSARFTEMFHEGRITCGASISVGNAREAGTLGALLKDASGALFGLSCNHVTGGCSNARGGLPIVAPAILDVGSGVPDPRTIGRHARALPFIQGDPSSVVDYKFNLDAAVFSILSADAVSSRQGAAYDTPAAALDPEEDALVEKVGRTTGHTKGFIECQLVGPLRVDYNVTVYHSAEENIGFKGTVYFEPVFVVRGIEGDFAFTGDSGSLIVRRDGDNPPKGAVGLAIGGGTNSETYMLPLKPILEKLGMRLVSAHG